MPDKSTIHTIEELLKQLASASWKERDDIKAELLRAAEADGDRDGVRGLLEDAKRAIQDLEVRWEVDEVLEAIAPPPPSPEPEDEPQPKDPNAPLQAADLDLVYDDPRGLMLHKAKTSDRWFATQRDPRTGQPQTFELHASELTQLRQQLAGSPYWVLGAGASQ